MNRFLLALAALMLSACASVTPADYAAQLPKLDLRMFFDGTVEGWGTIQDRSGKVTKRMYVVMKCSWNGDVGTLDEDFTYADGKKEKRVWTVRKNGDRYVGTAHDVVGEAQGEAAGNALRWSYTLRAQRDEGGTIDLQMDDWMWLLDERTMMNRTAFSKFGIRVGEVSFFFRKK